VTEIPERPDPLAPETVRAFVVAAHGDRDAVRDALRAEPRLVNACWDWGGGDWETGLGGAAHMGRRDIALHLLARGARLDVFAVAMLGDVDVVRALLQAFPTLPEVRGPHGISLIDHARAGGEDALEVVRLLEERAVAGRR
jgi:hypothetical protein